MKKRFLQATQTGVNAVAASITLANQTTVIEVKNAIKMTFFFTRSNHSSGSSLFEVYGSIDGTTFVALPMVDAVANTNAQNLTRLLSKSLAANGTSILVVEPLFCGVQYIKIVPSITTDGKSSAIAVIEDELMS